MAHDAGTATRLTRLLAEVDVDLQALCARSAEARDLANRDVASLSRAELVLLAVNLHGYYTALETLLERVARLYDDEVPAGAAWHQELISQMQIEVPGLRPAVVPHDTVTDLHELRKFRHFFRNAYVLELDPALVSENATRLARVHPRVAESIDAFCAHVRGALSALGMGG